MIQQNLKSHELHGHAHFYPPRNHWVLAFLNLHHHAIKKIIKKQFLPSIHSWDTDSLRVPWPDCDPTGHTHFWTSPPRKISVKWAISVYINPRLDFFTKKFSLARTPLALTKTSKLSIYHQDFNWLLVGFQTFSLEFQTRLWL